MKSRWHARVNRDCSSYFNIYGDNLQVLNVEFRLPYVPDLIARKLSGEENSILAQADVEYHFGEYQRLIGVLKAAAAESKLPNQPGGREELNEH